MARPWEEPWKRDRGVRRYVFDTLAVAVILVGAAMVLSAVLDGGSGLLRAWVPALITGLMLAIGIREWGSR
jgi:uncharacterized membrane protein YadS